VNPPVKTLGAPLWAPLKNREKGGKKPGPGKKSAKEKVRGKEP